ncbi:MAG: hypothetical protein ACKV2T_24510 [Kofleriaceae bacterium]
MLLAFLVSSIGLASAEPDTTSSSDEGSGAPNSDDLEGGFGDLRILDHEDGTRLDVIDHIQLGEELDDDPRLNDDDPRLDDDDDPRLDDDQHARVDDDHHPRLDDEGYGPDEVEAHIADDADATNTPTWAHGLDTREAALRRHASWLGRIDLSILWRRSLSETTAAGRDEAWLVGTWRL